MQSAPVSWIGVRWIGISRISVVVTGLALGLGMAAQAQQVVTKQYDDGSVYEGTFKNGRQDGTGTYTLPNGYIYTGAWVDGQIKGQGTARYPNGSVYEGSFEKGKPVGTGKITFPDGGT